MTRVSRKWTDQDFIDAVPRVVTWHGLARELGIGNSGQSFYTMKNTAARLDVSTTHFVKYVPHHNGGRSKTASDYLQVGKLVPGTKLRRLLVAEGLKPPGCEMCKNLEWLGEPMPLELDHINGDRYDNRLKNLQIICPNCHALTPTYKTKNWKRKPS